MTHQLSLFNPTQDQLRELYLQASTEFKANHAATKQSHCLANLTMFGIRGFFVRLCPIYKRGHYRPDYIEPSSEPAAP